MYDVSIHNGDDVRLIHDHRAASNAQKLTTASITDAVNSISAFKFEINPANIGYDQITEFGTIVKVWNSKRNRYVFVGRVLQIDPQMDEDGMMCKTVMCEDRLSYLHDSIQPYMAKRHFKGDSKRTGLEEFIDLLLDAHNSQVEPYKHIRRGRVTVDPFKSSENVTKGLDWESTYDAISEKLVGSFGGYIVLREEDGVLYLDYLESVGETRSTPIEVGYNMSSVRREINTSEIATRIIPLGYKYSSEDSDATDERLTIASVNNGVIYVESAELRAKYGIRYGVVIFDDVTEPGNLMRKGLEHFSENGGLTVSHDVSALELSLILDVDDLVIYDSYPVRNVALGIDETLQIVKKTTDVIEPYNSSFEMGDITKKMSDVMVGTAGSLNSIRQEVSQVGERVTKTEIQIVEATNQLASKISREEYDELGKRVDDTSSLVSQEADKIRAEVDADIAGLHSEISQTATEIRAEVSAIQIGGMNLLHNGGFYYGMDEWTRYEYGVNGEFRNAYVATENRDVPSLWLHAQNETGVFGVMQTVTGLIKGEKYILHGYVAARNCDGITVEVRDAHSSAWLLSKRFPVTAFGEDNLSLYEKFEAAFETGESTDINILLYCNSFRENAYVFLAQIKLEEGDMATAWTPNPEEFHAGSSITLTKDKVDITTKYFDVNVTDEDGTTPMLQITPDGATFEHASAPNVARRYDGPDVLYVNPNGESDEPNGYYKSLANALNSINNHWLDYDVTIRMTGGMTEYGQLMIIGVAGGGCLFITSGSANHANLYGMIRIRRCSAEVEITHLDVTVPADLTLSAFVVRSCSYVHIAECVATCHQPAFHISRGANVMAENNTMFVDDENSAYVFYGGRVHFQNNIGTGRLLCDGGVMTIAGTVPAGGVTYLNTFEPNNIDSVVPTGADGAPVAPVIETVQYPMIHADSYAAGNVDSWAYPQSKPSNDIYQGYTGQAGRLCGCIWFDNAAIRAALAGKTINQASLRLTAQKYVGRGVAVSVHLHGISTEYSSRNGAPTLVPSADYGIIGTATPGETITMTIPTAAMTDLANGTINGLTLFSDDTKDMEGRNYSQNYMRFDGETSGTADTKPLLTVVYEN